MESVIEELRNLNERFTAYVHRVKQLKNEEDVIALNNAICNLEEDLKRLRTSYECQINHLTTTLNILMDEKRQLEDELLARKENDTHFMDRISIESSKNAKLLLDISALKSDVSEKTNEIAALKLRIKELQISGSDGDSTKLKLTQEIDLLKQKLSLSEDLHTSTANQLQSVSMKLSSQEKFAKERLSRSQHRMQWYISQFAAKDSQIEEARKKEASIPTIIAKLRQKAQDELTRYSQKISDTYKNSIKTLQNQLLLERKENRQLRTKNLESDHQMLNLQQEIAELQSKVHSAARQSELLQSALESLNKENAHLRSSYEEKIQELESTITSSVSKVEYIHSSEDNILKEITRLKTMLEREEERLSLPLPAKKILLADENEKNKKEKCLKTDKIEYDDLYDGEIISRLDFAISPKVNEPLLMTSEVNNLDNSLNTNIEQNNEEFRYDNDNSVDDSIVHTLTDRGVTSSVNNHTTFNLSKSGSNAIGCLQICEIDPNGNYLHLWNSNTSQELDIGLYKIWQKYGQEKINEYTFPPDTRISPRTVFTLWSNNAIIPSTIQNTKNEFRCPNVSKWRHGPNCITILSNAYDEILAWLAPYTRCLTSRAERDNFLQNYTSNGLKYTPNYKRDCLMLTRQKSCALDNKSSPNLQSQHVSVTLPNYSVVDTEDWIKSSRCQSQTTVYELPKRYSSGSTNSSTTNGNTVITSNNNNINNNLIASRISSKSKNLISVDPPKSLQSSTFLNDNKVKKGYSNYPYFNVPRQSSQ